MRIIIITIVLFVTISCLEINGQMSLKFDNNLVVREDRQLSLPSPGIYFGQVSYRLIPEIVNTKQTYIIEFDATPLVPGMIPFSTMVIGKSPNGDAWSFRLQYHSFTASENLDGSVHYYTTFTVDESSGYEYGVSQRFIAEGEGVVGCSISNLTVSYADNQTIPNNLYVNRHLAVAGKVGIGISNPQSALDVNGTIRAKEVKIESTNWADFVFSPDYKLRPLSEVKRHIEEKQYLPDIPSASEVIENGVDLGEMQVKLLQKIEELTLYTIQLEERIKQLEDK